MDYSAPWSRLLIGVSVFATAILAGVGGINWFYLRDHGWIGSLVALSTVVVLGGCLLFTVRGYRLDGARLYVRRLLWETAVDLRGLELAEHDPAATKGSIRLMGNGGLFSFTGTFRNKKLGRYRAFVTDHARSVVLKTSEGTLVVSPGDPESFVADILGGQPAAAGRRLDSAKETK